MPVRTVHLPGLLSFLVLAACSGAGKDIAIGDDTGASSTDTGNPDADNDGDGYRAFEDCDDENADIHPGARERCDGLDNDCNGWIDEEDENLDTSTVETWYKDEDGDGDGQPDTGIEACIGPDGYVASGTDCDDDNVAVYGDAEEICDELDNDCDGETDNDPVDGDWYAPDADGDGFGYGDDLILACSGVDNVLDCDDEDPAEPQVADVNATGFATGSISAPWDSIQTAIDSANDCVVVYPGTYDEAIDFSGKSLKVVSVAGPARTIIDASSAGDAAVTIATGEGSGTLLRGFTITGGTGGASETSTSRSCGSGITCTEYYTTYCGGGVYVSDTSPDLEALIIIGNTLPAASTTTSGYDTYYVYSFGGGLCLMNSTAALSGLSVFENDADQGGALFVDEDSVIDLEHAYLASNSATDGGGIAVDGGQLVLRNVVAAWNSADSEGGGALIADGTLDMTNATLGGGSAPSGGGLSLSGTGAATVLNTIIYGSSSGVGVLAESTATYTSAYSNVYGNADGEYSGVTDPTGTDGNLSEDPTFTDVTDDGSYSNDDWSLSAASPSLDAGHPAPEYEDEDGSRNDQGAFGGPDGDWTP